MRFPDVTNSVRIALALLLVFALTLPLRASPSLTFGIAASGLTALAAPLEQEASSSAGTAKADDPAEEKEGYVAQTEKEASAAEDLTEAERIARVRRGLEEDRKRLRELEARLEDPESDYARAEEAFNELDEKLEAKKGALEKTGAEGAEGGSPTDEELKKLEEERTIARERFDLAIADRKILKEQITALKTRIQEADKTLKELSGVGEESASEPGATMEPVPSGEEPAAGGSEKTSTSGKGASAPPAEKAEPGTDATTSAAGEAADSGDGQEKPEEKKPASKQVIQAQKEAAEKEEDARGAEKDVERIARSIGALQKDVEAETALLESARKRVRVEEAAGEKLEEELRQKRVAQAPQEEIKDLEQRLEEVTANIQSSRERVEEHTLRLAELRARLAQQQVEEIAASKTASEKQRAAWWARVKATSMEWLFGHGPKILLILIGMAAGLFLVRFLSKRMIKFIIGSARDETREGRENRAKTLMGVFQNAAWVVIIVWGLVSILSEIGFPVGPILGGAAVAGLAVAFGAQRLIRDFFHGFVILLENQYGINDVVRVAGIAGLVERITLRMTVLRDLEGVVHFVPNGEITTVSNLTHGWSRAVFDVGVAYKEDVDEVMKIIQDVGRELREDPKFGRLILEDLTMLGLDMMADSAIVVKFFIKTRPIKQWDVKREMLRRIKKRFDEQGIEIPFPHRTVYHRYEDGGPGAHAPDGRPEQEA